jgi:Holliday junction DNA helicase RuvA
MIDSLRGKLTYKSPTYIRVDVNGVGYGLNVPVSTYNSLGDIGDDINIFTYFHVREDIMRLYGFKTEDDLATFKLLISVTLVGPQLALGILSSLSSEELKRAIIKDNFDKLDSVPGIGKKTAQRIIIELKEKISPVGEVLDDEITLNEDEASLVEEAVRALISLGCSKKEALLAIKTSYMMIKDKKPSLQELIGHALKQL